MTSGTTWMELKIIMLSKKNQSLKETLYDSINLTFLKIQNNRDGEQISGCQWWETAGERGLWLQKGG